MEGILGLWKEPGMTSHDCVFKLRKLLHMKKIGHSGTLDPGVAGVLPICLGQATKMVEYLQDTGKIYEGRVRLGFSTTTEDSEGDVVERVALTAAPDEATVDAAMAEFIGEIKQIPPMFSAVKVNGRRLYEYAREGLVIERPERAAQIDFFNRTSEINFDPDTQTAEFSFEVGCGKGTYVRTLAVDLGEKLGFPAHMSYLVRTKSGGLTKKDCLTLSEVAEKLADATFDTYLKPLQFAVRNFAKIEMSEDLFTMVNNGRPLAPKELGIPAESVGQKIALYYNGELVSIYQPHPTKENLYKPEKVFRKEN